MITKIDKMRAYWYFKRRWPNTILIGGNPLVRRLGLSDCDAMTGFYSQEGQDAFIATRFRAQLESSSFPKLFLDVGCNRPILYNNSYFFEKYLGFRVIAVDALTIHEEEWAAVRPGARFVGTAVGDKKGELVIQTTEHNSTDDMMTAVVGASCKSISQRSALKTVPVTTLENLLSDENVSTIGILSLDVEGYELAAIRGLSLDRFRPLIAMIENNSGKFMGEDLIRELMLDAGYTFYARIWELDDLFVHSSITSALTAGHLLHTSPQTSVSGDNGYSTTVYR